MFVFFFVPETKGRSLEQLDEMFAKRVGTRQFKNYVAEHVPVDSEKDPAAVLADTGKMREHVMMIENAEAER